MSTKKIKREKNALNRIITTVVTLILIAAIALCLFVTIQVLGKGYTSFGGYSFFRVITGSMEPEIPIGTLILTEQVDISTLNIGDIISFHSKSTDMLGRIITHRVVGIFSDEYGNIVLQTKGDNNTATDAYYVDSNNLIGKMIWRSGENDFFANTVSFFTGKIGFMACIALPCLLISGFILRDSVGKIKGDMEKVINQLAEDEVKKQKEKYTDTVEDPKASQNSENGLKAEEYEEMYLRIRAELIEELKQSETEQQSKN